MAKAKGRLGERRFQEIKIEIGASLGSRALEGGLGLNARRQMGQRSPSKLPRWAGLSPELG